MQVTVSDVMRETRNYFLHATYVGHFTVSQGQLMLSEPLASGSWVALEGAGACSGVYQLDEAGRLPNCPDGSWTGRVHLLSPSHDFLRLCQEIQDWVTTHPDSTIRAERFGEYSCTRDDSTWQKVFHPRLKAYQKMFAEVNC